MPIKIEQRGETFAARLSGLRLSPPCTAEDIATIISALDNYGVVILPDQSMTPDEQIAFTEQLGPLEDSDQGNAKYAAMREELTFRDKRVSEISNVADGGQLLGKTDMRRIFQYANQMWHTDSSFRPVRARYTMLLAVQVPAQGGETEFADMVAAYDGLPQETKEEIEGMNGVHSPWTVMDLLGASKPGQGDFTSELPDQVRPLVEVHPGSGRKLLNIGAHVSHIEGMTLPEGRALLIHLREHATGIRYRYRHRWTPGELVIWDDRSTMHRACRYQENDEPRQLVRTLVEDR